MKVKELKLKLKEYLEDVRDVSQYKSLEEAQDILDTYKIEENEDYDVLIEEGNDDDEGFYIRYSQDDSWLRIA